MANYGDWQLETYVAGLDDVRPDLPMSFEALEAAAQQAMPERIWSYVAGGAGDETTQRANAEAFARWGLVPRMLVGAAERDTAVELFGARFASPLMMAPVGVIGICDPDGHGDLAAARASARTGVPFIASTLMEDTLEDVAAATGDTPAWFQLYPPRERDLCASFVRRAEAAGYAAIVITLDTCTLGWRPRDLTLASFPQLGGAALRNYFVDEVFTSRLARPPAEDLRAATLYWASVFGNPGLGWDDLAWMRTLTDLPMLVKGICHPDDARRAVETGMDGIYCSTHGGRQANGGLPALQALPEVAAAVDVPVVFDSGVRSGADAVKALALGADAVAVGRPYAYGLAVGGEHGIDHVLRCLLAELDLTMAVDGYPDLASLTPDALRPVP